MDARGRTFAVLAVTVAAVIAVGCGPADDEPEAQPAPGVTTFEQGRFDDLPQYPRSEPLGPRSETDGAVTRSYKARNASPEQVLEFYEGALDERWVMATGIEQLGAGTYRADWTNDEFHLRVSATREPELDSQDDASVTAVAQYSLTLRPR